MIVKRRLTHDQKLELAARIRECVKRICAGREEEVHLRDGVSCSFYARANLVGVSVWAGVPTRKVFSANWSMYPKQNGIMTFRYGPWMDVILSARALRLA